MTDDRDPEVDSVWQIDVTDADIRVAKEAWLAAREADAPAERVQTLHAGYERLVRTQGRQVAEAFRRRHARR